MDNQVARHARDHCPVIPEWPEWHHVYTEASYQHELETVICTLEGRWWRIIANYPVKMDVMIAFECRWSEPNMSRLDTTGGWHRISLTTYPYTKAVAHKHSLMAGLETYLVLAAL